MWLTVLTESSFIPEHKALCFLSFSLELSSWVFVVVVVVIVVLVVV